MSAVRPLRPPGRPAAPIDADGTAYRLAEAGRNLLLLDREAPLSVAMCCALPELRRPVLDFHEQHGARLRPVTVTAELRERLVQAFGWLVLIGRPDRLCRAAVALRALVSPATERPLYDWRRLSVLFGIEPGAAQAAHRRGLAIIVDARRALAGGGT